MLQLKSVLSLVALKRLPIVAVRGYKPSGGSMVNRQARVLNKLMNGSREKKKPFFYGQTMPKTTELASTHRENKGGSRRVVMLNKMFMQHVTDQLASSRFRDEIHGLGIEITHVQVCQHFRGLNVFWFSTATDYQPDWIAERLAGIAFPLRHALSQLRLIGEVPRITFVQDKELMHQQLVDALLAKADFGDDHERNSYGQRVKKEFEPQFLDVNDVEDSVEETIPMRNDVFGVDRSAIMGRITTSMEKTKSAWDAYELSGKNSSMTDACPGSTISSLREEASNEKKTEQVLQDFLAKRKLDRKLRKNRNQISNEFEGESADRVEWENDKEYVDDDDDFDPLEIFDDTDPIENK